ncbi:histone-lysine N-methyltransferase SETMAR [Trichonephila clavipes]|nr:histone-lysine N-methyltransferase SETMAR [Trichonephila clavipes]
MVGSWRDGNEVTTTDALMLLNVFVCLALWSSIFDVKETPCTGRPVVKNVDKITEIIEIDLHVSSRSITQELKIDHKTILSYLRKVGFKRKLHVWVPHQLTPKNIMDQISICEALANGIKLTHFLIGW